MVRRFPSVPSAFLISTSDSLPIRFSSVPNVTRRATVRARLPNPFDGLHFLSTPGETRVRDGRDESGDQAAGESVPGGIYSTAAAGHRSEPKCKFCRSAEGQQWPCPVHRLGFRPPALPAFTYRYGRRKSVRGTSTGTTSES